MDMTKALREAALLRNRIESCCKATSNPQTGREIADYLVDIAGQGTKGYSRISTQLQQMVKRGQLEKLGRGISTTYRWIGESNSQVKINEKTVPELHLKINKEKHTLCFLFEGFKITIEVV